MGLCGAAQVKTVEFENLLSLKIKAEKFIKNSHLNEQYPLDIEIKPINNKLKLRQCDSKLEFTYSNLNKVSGNTLLKVSCNNPVSWKLNLPVKIGIFRDVLTLKSPVLRGQNIDSSMVIVKKLNQLNLKRGFYTHVDQLKLLQSRRNLKANTVLNPSNLKAKNLVEAGQQVTVVLNQLGFGIKISATALQSASNGQRVKVRNNSSLKTIEGIVNSNGYVLVN